MAAPASWLFGDLMAHPLLGKEESTKPPVNVWLQSRSLPARGRAGLEVHRCLCIIDAGNVFISTVDGAAWAAAGRPIFATGELRI